MLARITQSIILLAFTSVVFADGHPAAKQFDFLIGDHDVSLHGWTGADWTPPRPVNAIWNGRYGLEGNVIYDEWIDPQGGKGVNVRLYDEAESLWKMMWISTGAYQVQDLRAQMRDGVLTMWQVYPERPGWHAEFKILDKCRWAREGFQVDESGKTIPQFRLVATRRDCLSKSEIP